MDLVLGIAIYFICWWMVLFTVLPLGVKTQGEEGNVVPGTPQSAPATPAILKKMIITTIISSIIFGIIFWVIEAKIITLNDLPI